MDYVISVVQIIVYAVLYLPVKLFFQLNTTQFDAKEIKKGIVFVSNHQSRLDLFLIFGSITPKEFIHLIPIHGLVAEKYMDTWWKKLALICFGMHPLRKGLKESSKALLFILDLVDKKHTILLFPEGRVLKNKEKVQPNPGLGYLALKRDFKIVPTYLEGFRNVDFVKLLKRRYKAKVVFGGIENFYNRKKLNPQLVSNIVMNKIYNLSEL